MKKAVLVLTGLALSTSAFASNACVTSLNKIVFAEKSERSPTDFFPYSNPSNFFDVKARAKQAFKATGMAGSEILYSCEAPNEDLCIQPAHQGKWKAYGRWNTTFNTSVQGSAVSMKSARKIYNRPHWLQFSKSEWTERYSIDLNLNSMTFASKFIDNEESVLSGNRVIRNHGNCKVVQPQDVLTGLEKALAQDIALSIGGFQGKGSPRDNKAGDYESGVNFVINREGKIFQILDFITPTAAKFSLRNLESGEFLIANLADLAGFRSFHGQRIRNEADNSAEAVSALIQKHSSNWKCMIATDLLKGTPHERASTVGTMSPTRYTSIRLQSTNAKTIQAKIVQSGWALANIAHSESKRIDSATYTLNLRNIGPRVNPEMMPVWSTDKDGQATIGAVDAKLAAKQGLPSSAIAIGNMICL